MRLPRVRFTLRQLMALIVVIGVVLTTWLALRSRVPPVDPRKREEDWCSMPLHEGFWPKQGTSVSERDRILVKLARVIGPWQDGKYYGQSWWVTPNGMVNYELRSATLVGEGANPAPKEGLATLPALLKALPPSDPTAGLKDRVLVAFPINGRYVVRIYRHSALPSPVDDIAEALKPPMYCSDDFVPPPSR
ncbi:MAG: hypothetical protein ACLQGP_08110 [Isosphaeraceae bacterium]